MIATAVVQKTVFLVIMACTGMRDTACDDSVYAESWYGPESKEECETFIHRKEFDPSDYLTLGNHEYYAVRCE